MKPNFSIVLIAKNEEKTLPKLFNSLQPFFKRGGEVVIVDTGSTDNTVKLARKAGCVVDEAGERFMYTIDETIANDINNKFSEGEGEIVKAGDRLFDFAAARNYSATLASNDLISNQDCDEEYTILDIDAICKYIEEGFSQFEYNFVFSHDEFGGEAIKFIQCKFYDRRKLQWVGLVHEVLQPIVKTEIKRIILQENVLKLEHWQNPETPRGQYLKGLALDCFLKPDNDRNSHYFARELLWNGKPKSAIKEFKRHIAMDRWKAEMAQSMIYMGDAYAQLNDGDSQIEWYHRAFILDSSRREALLKLAHFFKYHNEPQKVAAYVAAAMQIPWDGFYANFRNHYENEPHELMYWAKGWKGDILGAQEHLLKALAFQPYNQIYLRDTKFYFEYPDNGIEGWMRFPELQFLYNNAKHMDSIIEVGSWKGKSTHALCSGCKNGQVTAVDHFLGSGEPQHKGAAKNDQIFKDFMKNTEGFDNLEVKRASSLDAAKDFPDKSFDMVFIDAGHTYEDVKADIRAWKSKAKILLCGHDFCNEWPEVRRAVIEELGYVETCDSIWYKYVCEMPKVSVVIPTLGREEKLLRLVQKIKENAGYSNYEIIIEADTFENRQGAPKTLKRGVEKSTGELVMFLGNDCIPEKDFMKLAVLKMAKCFPEMDGLVGLNDCYWTGEFATHWLASKKLLPYLEGEFFHTGYHHTGCDNELTERCRMIGKYVWCEEAKVYHDHPVQKGFQTWEMDEVYKLAYDSKNCAEDKALLNERAAKYGFSVKHSFGQPRQYPQVPDSIDLRKRIKNPEKLKVLNIGVGDGNSGMAIQLPHLKFKQLDHIDTCQEYLDNANSNSMVWDAQLVNFINKDVRDFNNFDDYDLILMFDVMEHLPKEDALKILKQVKNTIVFIPLEKEFRKNEFNVPEQEHLSLWTEQDFIDLGYKTEVLKGFHKTFDALFAFKTPSKTKSATTKQKIPKILYSIWLNDSEPMPEIAVKCIGSQHKFLPEYKKQFITLENCDRSSRYVREALDAKKWVKASDFLRMWYLYQTGGVYLDVDCEMLGNLDEMLENRMFVGMEPFKTYANGIVGAEPHHPFLKKYLEHVENNFFGGGDLIFEPGIRAFTDLIFISNHEEMGLKIYEPEYFFPYNHQDKSIKITPNTRIYHHYMKTWKK